MRIDITGMVVDRAHRIGSLYKALSANRDDPKRPIMVRFRDYRDTEHILENAYKLKGSNFGVDRDYPKEILDARKRLHKCKEAYEARRGKNKVQIKYPAKLYINDRLVRDEFPDWFSYMKVSRIEGFETERDGGQNRQYVQSAEKRPMNSTQPVMFAEKSDGVGRENVCDHVIERETYMQDPSQEWGHAHNSNTQNSYVDRSRDSNYENNETRLHSANISTPFSVDSLLFTSNKKVSQCIHGDTNEQNSTQWQLKGRGLTGSNENILANVPETVSRNYTCPINPKSSSERSDIPDSHLFNENKQCSQQNITPQTQTQRIPNRNPTENITRGDLHEKRAQDTSLFRSRPETRAGIERQTAGMVDNTRHPRSRSLSVVRRKDSYVHGYNVNVDERLFDFATGTSMQNKTADDVNTTVKLQFCATNKPVTNTCESRSDPNQQKQPEKTGTGNENNGNKNDQRDKNCENWPNDTQSDRVRRECENK